MRGGGGGGKWCTYGVSGMNVVMYCSACNNEGFEKKTLSIISPLTDMKKILPTPVGNTTCVCLKVLHVGRSTERPNKDRTQNGWHRQQRRGRLQVGGDERPSFTHVPSCTPNSGHSPHALRRRTVLLSLEKGAL